MTWEQRAKLDSTLRDIEPPAPTLTMAEQRAWYAELMSHMNVPDAIRTTETDLAGVRTLRVDPAGESRPGTILFFHGGSWVVGSPETELCLTAGLVVRTGCRAYSPDYRLAPEHPFPAGIEDTLGAYRALLDDGVDPSTIVFAGDSAGGGLTVTTCLAARDAGLPLPAAIVAFSPGLDLTRSGESMTAKADADPVLVRAALERTGAMYLAGQDPRQPLLSPAIAADLTGFPPMLIQVGTNELLLDDSTRLAARATAAGVDVVLDITAGVPHVFQSYTGVLDEADQALDRAAFFLRQHI
jgi:acetyl esterase/lipase